MCEHSATQRNPSGTNNNTTFSQQFLPHFDARSDAGMGLDNLLFVLTII